MLNSINLPFHFHIFRLFCNFAPELVSLIKSVGRFWDKNVDIDPKLP